MHELLVSSLSTLQQGNALVWSPQGVFAVNGEVKLQGDLTYNRYYPEIAKHLPGCTLMFASFGQCPLLPVNIDNKLFISSSRRLTLPMLVDLLSNQYASGTTIDGDVCVTNVEGASLNDLNGGTLAAMAVWDRIIGADRLG